MMGTGKSKEEMSTYNSIQEDWPWVWAIWDPECLDWKKGLSNEDVREIALQQARLPVPITENLFLGNAYSVGSIKKLKSRGITAVLNMAGPLALKRKTIQAYKNQGIQYKRLEADDDCNYPLLQKHWHEAFAFIQSTTENGKGKCVVHCVAGMNRSGLIAAAYYMLATKTVVLEAVKHVRRQRGNVALCNEGFQAQLVAMARENNLLGSAPATKGSIVQKSPTSAPKDHWLFAGDPPREDPLDELAITNYR